MSYFLFVDESGQDHQESPYEVLAGIAVEDRQVWPFIAQLHYLEEKHFGQRISDGLLELKAKKLLKRKTFRLACQMPPFEPLIRRDLARSCISKGTENSVPTKKELTALGQAKIAFVQDVLILCAQCRIRAFASIVNPAAPRPESRDRLRKDYIHLFERYFYFLEEQPSSPTGAVVFDELEKSQSHILAGQMETYFLKTSQGRERSGYIIPEPFFVHSDLTTLIQIADIVAYIISWGVEIRGLESPRRRELADFASRVCALRYETYREIGEKEHFRVWGFSIIDDLRPLPEQK